MFKREFHTPESVCPHCRHKVNACGIPFSLDSPSPGDLSVCIECGGFLEIQDDWTVQALKEEKELQVLLDHPETYKTLIAMRNAAISAKKERGDRHA